MWVTQLLYDNIITISNEFICGSSYPVDWILHHIRSTISLSTDCINVQLGINSFGSWKDVIARKGIVMDYYESW